MKYLLCSLEIAQNKGRLNFSVSGQGACWCFVTKRNKFPCVYVCVVEVCLTECVAHFVRPSPFGTISAWDQWARDTRTREAQICSIICTTSNCSTTPHLALQVTTRPNQDHFEKETLAVTVIQHPTGGPR